MKEDMDRISQLPEAIMEHILFLLPEDAIRMSFLSRAWKALWNSLPVSNFDFGINPNDDYDDPTHRNIRPEEITISKEKFITSVDEECLKILQHRKRMIQYFRLRIPPRRLQFDSDSSERQVIDQLDRWIKLVLVTGNFIRELDLVLPLPRRTWKNVEEALNQLIRKKAMPIWAHRAKVIQWYFPPTSFDVSSLVVLRLSNCILHKTLLIPKDDARFSCLKELRLANVYFEGVDVTRDLLSKCPSLENLELIDCHYNHSYHLQVCGLRKLKKVFIEFESTNIRYTIELGNLQTLHLFQASFELEDICCNNLKELVLMSGRYRPITSQYVVDKITSKFLFLEELTLLTALHLPELNISSHSLKKLTMESDCLLDHHCRSYVKELNIDTPNLLCFSYETCSADRIASKVSMNCLKLQVVNLQLRTKIHARLDTPWFLKLHEYVRMFTPHEALNLRIDPGWFDITFSLEELREENVVPLSEVMHLWLENIRLDQDYSSLVEGLLWTCHPKLLSVSVREPLSIRVKAQGKVLPPVIKVIYEKLTCNGENPSCCRENQVKCWRHCLESTEIQSYGTKDGHEIYDKDLSRFFDYLENNRKVTFELQWLE